MATRVRVLALRGWILTAQCSTASSISSVPPPQLTNIVSVVGQTKLNKTSEKKRFNQSWGTLADF